MKYFEMKKRAFMSIVNSLKGFIRKVSGTPPITLPDCVDNDSLISYSIEGNGIGDKTKNLFDMDKGFDNVIPALTNGVSYACNKTKVSETEWKFTYKNVATWHIIIPFSVKKNTQYTLSANFSQGTGYTGVATSCDNPDQWDLGVTTTAKGDRSISFNSGDNELLYFKGYLTYSGKTTTEYILKNIQLEEGATATEYEPFGYKIPIKMSGKNLFDYDNQTWITGILDLGSDTNYGGVNTSNINYRTTDFIKILEAGKDYVVSFTTTYVPVTSTSNRVCFYNEHKNIIGYAHINSCYEMKRYKYDVKVPKDTKYIRYSARITDIDILIEEGATETEYEPYVEPITTNIILDEPLIAGNVLEYPKDDIPKLPTVKGTTIYSVETDVQPTNMSVEYYATRKGE